MITQEHRALLKLHGWKVASDHAPRIQHTDGRTITGRQPIAAKLLDLQGDKVTQPKELAEQLSKSPTNDLAMPLINEGLEEGKNRHILPHVIHKPQPSPKVAAVQAGGLTVVLHEAKMLIGSKWIDCVVYYEPVFPDTVKVMERDSYMAMVMR